MSPSEQRLEQVAKHLSNNYGRGLLNGEVAIITGAFLVSFIGAPLPRLTLHKALLRYHPSMLLLLSLFSVTMS